MIFVSQNLEIGKPTKLEMWATNQNAYNRDFPSGSVVVAGVMTVRCDMDHEVVMTDLVTSLLRSALLRDYNIHNCRH